MPTIKVVSKTGLRKLNGNHGISQEEIFKVFGEEDKVLGKFKLNIKTESYANQSSINLYMWTSGKGFDLIAHRMPREDFNDCPTCAGQNWESTARPFYAKVTKEMKKLAKDFVD